MMRLALQVLVLVCLCLHFGVDRVNFFAHVCLDGGGHSVLVFFELVTDVMQLHPCLVKFSVVAQLYLL